MNSSASIAVILPKSERLEQARPHLELAYHHYGQSISLAKALKEDAALRFATLQQPNGTFPIRLLFASYSPPIRLTQAVVDLIEQVADSRNLARF